MMMTRRHPAACVAFAGAVLLAAATTQAETINKILATVDGEPVTMYEVQQFTKQNIRGRQLASGSPSALLDAVINERIVMKEVSDKGVVVRDEDVTRYIDNIRQRNNITEEQLAAVLAQQGMSMDDYRKQIREEIQRQQLVAREIRGKVNVTPEDIQRYYDEHKEEFSTPARVKVSHIFLRVPPDATPDQVAALTAKAEEIRERAVDGANFAELAKQYTEDGSGDQGGELGWFNRGQLLEPLEKAVEKLKVGQVSQPVRTSAGLHVVRLDEREGESHEDIEALREKIKEKLYAQALEERFDKWTNEDLRKRHQIEVFD